MYYILDRKNKVHKVKDLSAYSAWHKNRPKEIRTQRGIYIAFSRSDDKIVSTVFLGKPHGDDSKNPILWETVILSPNLKDIWRYSTMADAISGHIYACNQLEIT